MTDVPVVVADTAAEFPDTLTPGELVLTKSTGAFGHVSGGEPPLVKLASVDAIPEDAEVGDVFLVGTQTYTVQAGAPVTVTAPTMAQPTVSYTSISFSWYGSSGPVARYLFTLDNQPSVEVLDTAIDISGLMPGQTHTAYVTAQSTDGSFSEASAPITASTLRDGSAPVVIPGVPQAGELTETTVRFRFTVTDLESGVASAAIYWGDTLIEAAGPVDGDIWGVDIPLERLRAIGLLAYRIRAVDWSGNIGWSDAIEVTLAGPPVDNNTPPTGEITDPVDGTSFRSGRLVVKIAARSDNAAVTSVFLRTAELGEIAEARLVSPGIWQTEITVGNVEYGDNEIFARITNNAGVYFDTATITIERELPAVTPTGRGFITGPWLDGSFEPIRNGRLVIRQRLPFDNALGYVTTAGIEVDVRDGKFLLRGVEGPIPVGFPPIDLGFEVDEEPGDGGTARLGLLRGFPEGTVDGQEVPYGKLVPLELESLPEGAYMAVGVTEVLAAAAQVAADREYIEEQLGSSTPVIAYDASIDAYRITIREN